MISLSRRKFLWLSAAAGASMAFTSRRLVDGADDPDLARLVAWVGRLRGEGLAKAVTSFGPGVTRAGELAEGSPYEAGALDAYLRDGGVTDPEPLTLSLTRFDCVTLVESCLAVARVAGDDGAPTWSAFGRQIERMRYRGGSRGGYGSRLHYFSEWISDGAARGLVRDVGAELGGEPDARPLRFMTEHRASYPALADNRVFEQIAAVERRLDGAPRQLVPLARIAGVVDRIETGDVLAFATEIPGLDVTHAALACRDHLGVLRVLHAPLSGGVVQVSSTALPDYVAALRHSPGVLVARPQAAPWP